MSETTPPELTLMHQGEIDYQTPVHEEQIRKLIQNFNYLGVLIPVGTIIWFQLNQIGVNAPNASVWQLCDGSEITLPASPLKTIGINTRNVPNLLSKYPRPALNTTTNPTGGTQTYSVAHSHGGSTGGDDPGGSQQYEAGGNRRHRVSHTHSIDEDLGDVTVDAPAWVKLVPYMKIA